MTDETDTTSEVARVLGEHAEHLDAERMTCCACEWSCDDSPRHAPAHLAHQAAMLAEAGLLRDGSNARLSDLTARIGFGDGVTEPQADNDTIVKAVNEAMTNSNTLWEVEEQVERVRALAQWFRDQGQTGYARKVEEAVSGDVARNGPTNEAIENPFRMPEDRAPVDAWPFKPGDVVRDSGEDGDDAAWLDAAPQKTVLVDSQGTEWVRLGDGWFLNDPPVRASRWASLNLEQTYGPLSVVSVGKDAP